MGIIYKATNLDNDMIYIGQTMERLEDRIDGHLNSGRERFDKYVKGEVKDINDKQFSMAFFLDGVENFEFEIIENCKDRIKLNEKEKYWIEYYNNILGKDMVYNIQKGGHYSSGINTKDISMYTKLYKDSDRYCQCEKIADKEMIIV